MSRCLTFTFVFIAFVLSAGFDRACAAEHSVALAVNTLVIEIDPATGDRTGFDLDDYPRTISSSACSLQADGSIFVGTFDALDRSGIYQLFPSTGTKSAVSGGVDGFESELRGGGPPIVKQLKTVLRDGDSLYILRVQGGPMQVDIASGNRRAITLTDQLETTDTLPAIPLRQLQDMVLVNHDELLVADPVQGLVRIAIRTGERTRLFPQPTSFPNPIRMDLLPDGRLIYSILNTNDPAIWALDIHTGEVTLYSGTAGETTRGEGPPFAVAYDLAVDLEGRLWIYDALTLALFEVKPNGDRIIAASERLGSGEFMPGVLNAPLLGTYARLVEPPAEGWLVY